MSKFNVGDKVRVVGEDSGYRYRSPGEEGVVSAVVNEDSPMDTEYVVMFTTADADGDWDLSFCDYEIELVEPTEVDAVNHPAYYTAYGAEVIEITEHLNFCRGSAVKYIARAGLKDPDKELEDLEKAAWCLNREIARVKGASK